MILMSDQQLADLHVVGPGCGTQCFPFYTYDEDGKNRQENITDWALATVPKRTTMTIPSPSGTFSTTTMPSCTIP